MDEILGLIANQYFQEVNIGLRQGGLEYKIATAMGLDYHKNSLIS